MAESNLKATQATLVAAKATLTSARAAQEGAEDSPEGGARDVDALDVGAKDFLIGIAASGGTPYVRGALARARERGARTAILACTPPPTAMLGVADIAIVPITGPEVVTGSTRMKAGTATKLVLNMITSGAMIRLGKTFGNGASDGRDRVRRGGERGSRNVGEAGRDSDQKQGLA